MKSVLFISVVLFNFKLVLSQPISTPSIEIKKIMSKNKSLCFTTVNGIDYTLSIKKKCKQCEKSYNYNNALISVNRVSKFIYKKDTMRLKLLFDSHSIFRFQIDKLLFQKGDIVVDLKKCKEVLDSNYFPTFTIRKLPNDCMKYIKENEEP
ncbi:hypothetical protein AX016_0068 [Cellulophaga sp. RHA19]|uniref:hypothetical protein n=1 Tax=Cellulophaga sp. RHA19 TaxID=1798237 RepID=UPI000CB9F967|nr:hypothetical protein [Cellulophaga sp. RHA19]PKB41914.1 hypothetical protein AX016_0068 [Cellulophaga sp. RHA19]